MGLRARSGGFILLVAGAVVALSAPALGSAVAARPLPTTSWPAQVARPAAASCPRGETLIAPTSGRTDALGVAHLTYKLVPGLVANIPPRGLTARHITPAVMADLGMDVHQPATSGERQLVQSVLNLAKDRTAPEFCRATLPNTHVYTGNWAGYAVTESEYGSGINGTTGSWAVPRSMTKSEPSAESTWVGIGGGLGEKSKTNGLIQTGTSMQYDEGYRTFWEYIGSSGCTGFCGKYSSVNAVSPGVSIVADVWWDTRTTATFLLETSNNKGEWDVTNRSVNIPYDHTSAEWIDENHLADGFYYDSPGTVHFSGQGLTSAFGGQGSLTSPFKGSFEAVIMKLAKTTGTNCSNKDVLSYPADAENTSGGGSSEIVTCTRKGIDSP